MRNSLVTFLLLLAIPYFCFSQISDSTLVVQNTITQKKNTESSLPDSTTTTTDSSNIHDYKLMNKLEVNHTPTITQPIVTKKPERIYRDILLAIKVVDKYTNTPLNAIVQTVSHPHTKGQGVCNSDGKFHFNINNYSDIEIRISKRGYHTYVDTVDIVKEGFEGNIYTKVYTLIPFKKGDIVALNNIYFKQGDDHLLPNSHPSLDKLTEMMRLNPSMVILLGGHTENKGSKKQLIELSTRRVNAVRFYLLQKGIKLNRIKTIGYGPSHPIYHGNDPNKQKINRRVDFKIIKT